MSEKHEIQVRFLSLAQQAEKKEKFFNSDLLSSDHLDHTGNEVNEELRSVIGHNRYCFPDILLCFMRGAVEVELSVTELISHMALLDM